MVDKNIEEMFTKIVPLVKSVCITYETNAERSIDIISKRFGFYGEPKRTLEEIGVYYGITRERVRQIEEKLLIIFSSLIMNGKYIKKFKKKELPYYLEDSFYEQLNVFINRLDLEKPYLLITKVEKITKIIYDDFKYKGELDFLLTLLNYKRIVNISARFELEDGWCHEEFYELIEPTIRSLEEIFRQNAIKNIQLFDLILRLKKSYPDLYITDDNIINIIYLISGVKIDDSKRTLIIDNSYLSPINKAFYYLEEHGPTNLTELTRIINIGYHRIIREDNIRNQMSQDERFSAIGKSGFWQLKNTKNSVENISIVEAMERCLHRAGVPLRIDDLYIQIKDMRGDSFKEKSIRTYAAMDKRFVIIDNKVALAVWKLATLELKKQKIPENFNEQLSMFLQVGQDILLTDIVKHFLSLGWKEQTVRSKLKHLREVKFLEEVKNSPLAFGPNKAIRLVKDLSELENYSFRILLRDQVKNEILRILGENPNVKLTKGELYIKLNKNVKCIKQTYYTYLAELKEHPNIKFTEDNNKYYVEFTN